MSMKYLQLASEEQQDDVRKGLNCTKDSIKKDIQHLIEWMEKQPHLPTLRDEDVLERCLLNCKNSLEKTKSRLESFFSFRALYPEIFRDRTFDEKIEYIFSSFGVYFPLRKLTPDGYRVMISYVFGNMETSTDFSIMDNYIRACQITIDMLYKYDYAKGLIILYEGKHVNFSVATAFSASLRKMMVLYKKLLPHRYHRFYACNMGKTSEYLFSIFKPMLLDKLVGRIEILKNPSDIINFLPKEIIPQDYGGDELPLEELKNLWCEELRNQHEFLKTTENWMADLSKVPEHQTNSEFSGLSGSFRQISVD